MSNDINKTDTATDDAAMDQTTHSYALDKEYVCKGAEIGKDIATGQRVFMVKGVQTLENDLMGPYKGLLNLVRLDARPAAEAKALHAKGASVSNGKRQKKRDIQDICDQVLGHRISKAKAAKYIDDTSWIDTDDIDVYAVAIAKVAQRALEGDKKAAEILRDTAGDVPTTKQQISATMSDQDRALLNFCAKLFGDNSDQITDSSAPENQLFTK